MRAIMLCGLLLLGGCTPSQLYVQADRKFFDAIKGPHLRYVEADESLSPEMKQRRVTLFEEKEKLIRAAEGR